MIKVEIAGIAIDKASNSPVVLLRDIKEKKRILPIWIGPYEAEAISQGLRGEKFKRPLTHDLILSILRGLKVDISEVVVSSLTDDTYYAEIYLKKDNSIFKIDSRPSDSLALASKNKVPIYIDEEVMEKGSIKLEIDENQKIQDIRKYMEDINPEDFGKFRM
ncbi:MAG: bifunctional nuclease family protein [Candidatus Stahlbacteria bacterium]|jgi:bifunctional DNase/RNase|nr:bifunctional nuclease family protein [candidate division WOR-3 bacterium]TET97912.1 MAG: bifunctional nuclease family protein [Candidatus Stahlbacteria bacterium]